MKKIVFYIVLSLSIFLFLSGIIFGNLDEGIRSKAITICFECIGIG